MTVATIQIQLDDRAAQLYEVVPETKRRRLRQLIGFMVQEFTESTPQSLLTLMDEMSQEAAANGLTQEVLESILNANE